MAVFLGPPHSLHLTEILLPDPGPPDALARWLHAGIRRADREIIEAKFVRAPGAHASS